MASRDAFQWSGIVIAHPRRNLTLRPKIGPRDPYRRTSSLVESDGLVRSSAAPSLDLVKNPDTHTRCVSEFFEGSGESDRHDPKLDLSSNPVNPKIQLTSLDKIAKTASMPKEWPQRDYFRSLVDAKAFDGESKVEQAHRLDIAFSSFVTYYSGNREPGKSLLKRMSEYYGVPLANLTDDPGAELPGFQAGELAGLSPAKRLILRSFAQKLEHPLVTDEEAERVWRAMESLLKPKK